MRNLKSNPSSESSENSENKTLCFIFSKHWALNSWDQNELFYSFLKKNIASHAKIFQEKFSTMTVFIPWKFGANCEYTFPILLMLYTPFTILCSFEPSVPQRWWMFKMSCHLSGFRFLKVQFFPDYSPGNHVHISDTIPTVSAWWCWHWAPPTYRFPSQSHRPHLCRQIYSWGHPSSSWRHPCLSSCAQSPLAFCEGMNIHENANRGGPHQAIGEGLNMLMCRCE